MALYTIQQRSEDLPSGDEAVFVRQSFSWSAFLFGPFWLARYRLWLAVLMWILAYLILTVVGFRYLTPSATFWIIVALQGLLGFEASRLIEARLAAQGYRLTDVIAAANRDEAEVTYFRHRESANVLSIPPSSVES